MAAENMSSPSIVNANSVVPVANHNKIVDELKSDLAWAQKEFNEAEAMISNMWHNHEVLIIAIVAAIAGAILATIF